jgi:hypothetical protein
MRENMKLLAVLLWNKLKQNATYLTRPAQKIKSSGEQRWNLKGFKYMKKYKVTFPLCNSMSQISYIIKSYPQETKEKAALWAYNKSREHDGLLPLKRLPKGVKFTPIFE